MTPADVRASDPDRRIPVRLVPNAGREVVTAYNRCTLRTCEFCGEAVVLGLAPAARTCDRCGRGLSESGVVVSDD